MKRKTFLLGKPNFYVHNLPRMLLLLVFYLFPNWLNLKDRMYSANHSNNYIRYSIFSLRYQPLTKSAINGKASPQKERQERNNAKQRHPTCNKRSYNRTSSSGLVAFSFLSSRRLVSLLFALLTNSWLRSIVRCPKTALTALSRPFRSSFTFSELPALAYIQRFRNSSMKNTE